jgi:lactoylglutathione lyase
MSAHPPFRVLGVQQIAIGGADKQLLARLWVELLGLTRVGNYRSDRENVDEDILRVGEGAHAVEIDLMQPIDPARSPKVQTPPLNHIGLWVDDLELAYGWLKGRGVRFAGEIRAGAAGHRVAFIHPKGDADSPRGGEGVLIELVQAPPDVLEALSGPSS